MKINDVTIEYTQNPIGLDTLCPRFAWKLQSGKRGCCQSAWQIMVARDEEFARCVWNSGMQKSRKSAQIAYAGEPLEKFTRYYVRIKAWDEGGRETEWSETAFFEMSMLSYQDWTAEWITPEYDFTAPKTACPILRKEFKIPGKVEKARVYVTAKGLYELRLNGRKVGRDYLTPGWTVYDKRLMYQTYDVTEMLKEGGNAIGAVIGNGWYQGELGWRSRRNLYGGREALILELHMTLADGTSMKILSDGSWQSSYRGPLVYDEIYHGEIYDGRKEIEFDRYGCRFADWFGVRVMGGVTKEVLHAQECPPVREMITLRPKRLIITPAGEQVLDMGQEMTGHMRFRVKGRKGEKVILHHAEILDGEGNFYTDNLKGAKQRVEYILGSGDEVIFQPHFTFQGFRYVKVESFPGDLTLDAFEGAVLYSDLRQTGSFECSDENLQKLMENIMWSQRGNFVDIPTDCPQRCERLGWTGDIQVFAGTAALQMEIPLFLRKWLHDLSAEQFAGGGVPWVVPNIYDDTYAYDLAGFTGQSEKVSAAWGDAATICPWSLYLAYGDVRILEEQYESMRSYVEFIRGQGPCEYTWQGGHQLGDWVALDAPYGSFVGATDVDYIAAAYYAKSTEILFKAAKILGKKKDAENYEALYENIVNKFRQMYLKEDGSLSVETQTAIVLAVQFALVPEEIAISLTADLADWLKRTNYDLITGFVGTPYICHVLAEHGQPEAAYKLLMKKEYPSWLYQVTRGATTVWEHLDGIKPDGTLWNPRMNSFNHYAYGSVAEWVYRGIAGLRNVEEYPGYERFIIRPELGGGLKHVRFIYESMYGTIISGWKLDGNIVEYDITIPTNTRAEVWLQGDHIAEHGVLVERMPEAEDYEKLSDRHRFTLGAGVYHFIGEM